MRNSKRALLLSGLLLLAIIVAIAGCISVTPTLPPTPTLPTTPIPPSPTPTVLPTPTGIPVTPTALPTSTAAPPTLQPTSTSAPLPPTPTNAPLTPPDAVGLKLVAQGFASPVGLAPSPDGTGRLFVVDQIGLIRIIAADGSLLDPPFLDVKNKMVGLVPAYDERGLLGLAFHPGFKQNGRFFVYYSAPLRAGAPQGWNCTSVISEFKVTAGDPNKADPASERIVLQIDKPQGNHNAGQITFGPDGFLYIAIGDGGGANDVGVGHNPAIGNGQDITDLLGNILRLDVDGGTPYGIPADNPFVGKPGSDEVYAFGLRNPYRISFDMGGAHELFVSDAGQALLEEVNIVTRGGNYGWRVKEASTFFDPGNPAVPAPTGPSVDAAGNPFIDPILEYPHSGTGIVGVAVIGGFVYRGTQVPGMQGAYVFGDYSARRDQADGRLFMGTRSAATGKWTMKELRINTSPDGKLNSFMRSFGQDSAGEVYALAADAPGPSGATGKVFKLVP